VLSLCGLAKLTAGHYQGSTDVSRVDLNLLIAGVVLHDIGKIYELGYERGFNYTAEGQLLGHIAIAIRMLADKLQAFPQFPVELRNLIEHMILSHHGHLEFGSPKVPIFPEALLLHYLDDLDSKMECMRALIEKEPLAEGLFTPYSHSLERVALRKSRYLDPPQPPSSNAVPAGDPRANKPGADDFDSPVPDVPRLFSPQSAAPSKPKFAPAAQGTFGARLQQALNDERK
jgi:3'-5' exoribonuclease